MEKHKIPLACKIQLKLGKKDMYGFNIYKSIHCMMGHKEKCEGCKGNIAEHFQEGFQQGVKDYMKIDTALMETGKKVAEKLEARNLIAENAIIEIEELHADFGTAKNTKDEGGTEQ